jgi:hypothetical protein
MSFGESLMLVTARSMWLLTVADCDELLLALFGSP